MKVVAFIVEWHTPELLDLCLASLRTFAPTVVPNVVYGGPGAMYHGLRIHEYQARLRDETDHPDVVILLDTDVVVTSPHWLRAMTNGLGTCRQAIGGLRSRGDASQIFIDGRPILHASCLAMTRAWFLRQSSFAAEYDEVTEFVQLDTAHQVSMGTVPYIYPFRRVGHGPLFPGVQVGEYFDPVSNETLWAHCWRGTSASPRHRLHVAWRRFRARLGSPSAITLMRAEDRRRAFLQRGWEIVNGARASHGVP